MRVRVSVRRSLSGAGTAVLRALSSSTQRSRSQFGFQASDHSSPAADCVLLERSLRLGCEVFVCSAGRSTAPLERLAEIQAIEEEDVLQRVVVGNRVKELSNCEQETEIAVESASGRFLDFSTVPLSLEDISRDRVEPSSVESSLRLLLKSDEGAAGHVGVELNSELLRHCILHDSPALFKNLKLISSSKYTLETLLDQLQALQSEGLLSVLLCACNVFTFPVAMELRKWAAKKGVNFMASEVLRAHPRSPGLLVSPLVSNFGISSLPSMSMDEAVKLFNKTVNTCIHLETTFLQKVRDAHNGALPVNFPPLTDFCVGMALAQAQKSVLFPQEWKAIVENQVNPNFDKACETLRSALSDNEVIECENFLTVYVPMKRNLIRAFEGALNARQELLCNDLTEATAKELCGYLRLNVAEGESFTGDANEILIKNMSLHESISRAWMNVVRCPYDGEYNLVNHELGESVLLNGVEVPAQLWSESHAGGLQALGGMSDFSSSRVYLQCLSKCLDSEFYANT